MDAELNSEPLPGYRLIEKIGAGGYGEVWRAEAPGGLEKAIKLVFGMQHEKRATHELRSLTRIKELRHPFLLSLERIEIAGGRLVVVTELADESLKDLFDRCCDRGLPGVPHDDLLGYLRDAADALDFMTDKHSLQHLDIKPENLLLVAGHVKVADFGLVKDVQQSQASIVGGMTPLYSAPEVFRGSPSRTSDQYSLAILYQEMLTGTLPFPGTTAAELTLQHLNDEPNLTVLSSADRYVVARALSKNPENRYTSSRAFVDALAHASSDDEKNRPDLVVPRAGAVRPQRGTIATQVFDDDSVEAVHSEAILIDMPAADASAVVDLGPLDLAAPALQAVPTLFLGVGGTGGKVLAQLRRQFGERHGSMANVPALQTLALDTDPKAILDLSHQDGYGMDTEELLTLPLHRPQHYRQNSARLLSWLSRRWLYNIPRSMRTEGLRPLGRLALVDHARQTCQRIRQSITRAVDPQNLAASQEATGIPFAKCACRVYLVSSISGGTGSGMLLDLAYAVRSALAKLDLERSETIAILTHSTGRDPRFCDLARVNAFSWLNEFNHFCRSEVNYPGDASCGFPAHQAGIKPFDQTYLLHLGEGLDTDSFERATHSVARYLHTDTLSPARAFFDACRQDATDACRQDATDASRQDATDASRQDATESTASPQRASLRSFGVHRVEAAPADVCVSLAGSLCDRVAASWLGEADRQVSFTATARATERDEQATPSVEGGDALLDELQLAPEKLVANTQELIDGSLGSDAESFLDQWMADALADSPQDNVAGEIRAVDSFFVRAEEGQPLDASLLVGPLQISLLVRPLEEQLRTRMRDWLTSHVDDPSQRLTGARQAADWLLLQLESMRKTLAGSLRTVNGRIVTLCQSATQPAPGELSPETPETQPANVPLEYFRLRLHQCSWVAAEHLVRLLIADVKQTADDLNRFGRELKQLVARVSGDARDEALASGHSPANDSREVVRRTIRAQTSDLCAKVNRRLHTEFLNDHGGLFSTIMHGGRPRAQLLSALRDKAQSVLHEALEEVNVMDSLLSDDPQEQAEKLQNCVDEAHPELLAQGGVRRKLALLPAAASQADADRVNAALSQQTTVMYGDDNGFSMYVEAEGLPLIATAIRLVQCRRDYAEFAERVRTRNDVRWSRLTDELTIGDEPAPQPAVVATQQLPELGAPAPDCTQLLPS